MNDFYIAMAEVLEKAAADCRSRVQTDAAEAVAKTEEQAEAKPEKTKEKEVTLEDIRAVLAVKSQEGLTDKVKDLLTSFGAAKLSAVDKAKLPELYEAAKKL